MNKKHTPSMEEIRRHWGLAVDTHRREERLAEFDRMIESIKAEAWDEGEDSVTLQHDFYGSFLNYKDNPYE